MGGVDATKLRQYLSHLDPHHGLAHSIVVHITGQWLYEHALSNFLQLAVGYHPMQEYARRVLL